MSNKVFPKIILLFCIVIILIIDTTVLAFGAAYGVQGTPEIILFESDKTFVEQNEMFTLNWQVANAEKVELIMNNATGYALPAEGAMRMWLLETTTFILKAYGNNGEIVTDVLTVNISQLKVDYFTATPDEIAPGETVLIAWSIPNACTVSIPKLTAKDLSFDGVIETMPYTTTTYTLEATGFDGSYVSREITVNVKGAEIFHFTADKAQITSGESVTLSWDACYFKNLRLLDVSSESLPLKGSIEVKPTHTTTYTLEGTTYDDQIITREITIYVQSLQITHFSASKTNIHKGDMITLFWHTINASKCTLTTNYGHKLTNRPPNGMIAVTPNRAMTFSLIAEDAFGNTVQESLDVSLVIQKETE